MKSASVANTSACMMAPPDRWTVLADTSSSSSVPSSSSSSVWGSVQQLLADSPLALSNSDAAGPIVGDMLEQISLQAWHQPALGPMQQQSLPPALAAPAGAAAHAALRPPSAPQGFSEQSLPPTSTRQPALTCWKCCQATSTHVLGQHGDCTCDLSTPLGSGSFGMVVPGWYYDEPVAVKLLSSKFGEDEAAVRSRILREVQLQARASSHGGVVRFVAMCFSPPAIVMKMCECSLSARILNHWAAQPSPAATDTQQQPSQQQQQQPPLPPQHQLELSWGLVLSLLRQAAAALAFLHRPGHHTILHNDVRAANLVLTRSYQGHKPGLKLKICDFGLAAAAGPGGVATVPEITHAAWCAPELRLPDAYNPATGLYTVTAATDVFALGCVLHEMMMVGLPQAAEFPSAEKRLPGLAGCPPQGLEELFQSCVAQANVRCTAQAAVAKLQSMQAGGLL